MKIDTQHFSCLNQILFHALHLSKQEGSPVRHLSPKHSPCLEPLQEDLEYVTDDVEEEEDVPPQEMEVEPATVVKTEDKAVSTHTEERPSFFRRVLQASLPIQILMILYVVVVIVLPSVVINGRGECEFSMTDRLMFNGRKWVPTVRYTRGSPPI